MFVDSSAILAILTDDPQSPAILARLEQAPRAHTSPIVVYETVAALTRMFACLPQEATEIVKEFISEAGIESVHITDSISALAIDAFRRYGRGLHPASLGLTDCFAYACARAYRWPILFAGKAFAQTDAKIA